MDEARADPALADTRLAMVNLLRDTMSYWSSDSELSDVSDFPFFLLSFNSFNQVYKSDMTYSSPVGHQRLDAINNISPARSYIDLPTTCTPP